MQNTPQSIVNLVSVTEGLDEAINKLQQDIRYCFTGTKEHDISDATTKATLVTYGIRHSDQRREFGWFSSKQFVLWVNKNCA